MARAINSDIPIWYYVNDLHMQNKINLTLGLFSLCLYLHHKNNVVALFL